MKLNDEDDEPTPAEAVAMHLWRNLPESVPVYTQPPVSTSTEEP